MNAWFSEVVAIAAVYESERARERERPLFCTAVGGEAPEGVGAGGLMWTGCWMAWLEELLALSLGPGKCSGPLACLCSYPVNRTWGDINHRRKNKVWLHDDIVSLPVIQDAFVKLELLFQRNEYHNLKQLSYQ